MDFHARFEVTSLEFVHCLTSFFHSLALTGSVVSLESALAFADLDEDEEDNKSGSIQGLLGK